MLRRTRLLAALGALFAIVPVAGSALAGEKETSHPFFWAPFVLVGDGGATATP